MYAFSPCSSAFCGGAQHSQVVGVCVDQCLHRPVPAVGVRYPVSGFPGLLAVIGPGVSPLPLSRPYSPSFLGTKIPSLAALAAGWLMVRRLFQFILAGGHGYRVERQMVAVVQPDGVAGRVLTRISVSRSTGPLIIVMKSTSELPSR